MATGMLARDSRPPTNVQVLIATKPVDRVQSRFMPVAVWPAYGSSFPIGLKWIWSKCRRVFHNAIISAYPEEKTGPPVDQRSARTSNYGLTFRLHAI